MNYLDALAKAHSTLRPSRYFEIGCRHGYSLKLANCPSIAVDPAPELLVSFDEAPRIFAETSDSFFERADVAEIIGGPVDLAFIDGMHLVENVLKDFINIERHSSSGTVVVLDDVLPEKLMYATRDRNTQIWCGDVYRIVPLLRHYRPDLRVVTVDIELKGLAFIYGLDATSCVLPGAFNAICAELERGQFNATSADDLRSQSDPLHPDQLPALLEELARARASC